MYDHGARHYDPITGRWNTMDKLCELAFDRSPYSSCHDNPVKYIDPDGMYDTEAEAAEAAKKKKARYYQDQKTKKWFVSLNADGDGAYTSGNTVTRDFGENGNAAIDAIGFAGTGGVFVCIQILL